MSVYSVNMTWRLTCDRMLARHLVRVPPRRRGLGQRRRRGRRHHALPLGPIIEARRAPLAAGCAGQEPAARPRPLPRTPPRPVAPEPALEPEPEPVLGAVPKTVRFRFSVFSFSLPVSQGLLWRHSWPSGFLAEVRHPLRQSVRGLGLFHLSATRFFTRPCACLM
jgi:hypothetical protein